MDIMINELKAYFKTKGITQIQIAEMTGVNQSYIAALLNGKKQFGKKQAQKWYEIFGLSPNWLLTGEGDMFPPPVVQNNKNGDNINGHTIKVAKKNDTERFLDTIKECHDLLRKKDEQIDRLLTLLEKKQ